jgi:hypothetical protein
MVMQHNTLDLWWEVSMGGYLVILWIYTAHYCPSNRTEHKGGRALNGK